MWTEKLISRSSGGSVKSVRNPLPQFLSADLDWSLFIQKFIRWLLTESRNLHIFCISQAVRGINTLLCG